MAGRKHHFNPFLRYSHTELGGFGRREGHKGENELFCKYEPPQKSTCQEWDLNPRLHTETRIPNRGKAKP